MAFSKVWGDFFLPQSTVKCFFYFFATDRKKENEVLFSHGIEIFCSMHREKIKGQIRKSNSLNESAQMLYS